MSIYAELGVHPFINALAPYTRYGGSIMPGPVVQAMLEASRSFVNLHELQTRVGENVAEMTQNEACYVSSGAASGLLLATAACIAGADPAAAAQLPDTTGLKDRIVIQACDRFDEDFAVQAAGGRFVEYGCRERGTEDNLKHAIDERTAAVLYVAWDDPGKVPFERVMAIATERKVPVIVDAAGTVPPRENLWRFTRDGGADAVVVSGGKYIHGPQDTGLILGKRWLIEACRLHGAPYCRIGRGMKVSKEDLVGIYAAVKYFMDADEDGESRNFRLKAEMIASRLDGIRGVRSITATGAVVDVELDEPNLGVTADEVRKLLLEGSPSVLVGGVAGRLAIRTEMLQSGEEETVCRQVVSVLTSKIPVSAGA